MGRPTGFADMVGLPGSLRRTKRFISFNRASAVSREKDSTLREVRNFLKATSSCEQAATSVSRSAAAGPEGGGAATSPRELDSCAVTRLHTNAQPSKTRTPQGFRIFNLSPSREFVEAA